MDDGDDSVGYRRPPRHTQFVKGQSGNPRGRPRGARGLKGEIKAELDEMVTVTIDGRAKRMRKRRLVIKALAAKALKGNVAAADKLIALAIQAEGMGDEPVAKAGLSDTDRLILAQFLGRESADDPVPGAVAAALSKQRGSHFPIWLPAQFGQPVPRFVLILLDPRSCSRHRPPSAIGA